MTEATQNSFTFHRNVVFAALCVAGSFLGCGSNPSVTNGGGGPLAITAQPVSQSVSLGLTANFAVTATPAASVSYQWAKNGTAIGGATAASYSIASVAADDSGSMFTVTVSEGTSSVTSQAATLTVGPRSPANGDLRFQLVDSPAISIWFSTPGSIATDVVSDTSGQGTNATVSPLNLIGENQCINSVPHDCGWSIELAPVPEGQSGLTAMWQSKLYSTVATDLAALSTPQTVITSLDLQQADDAYAVTAMRTTQNGGFDLRVEAVPSSSVSATVASDAAKSRVATAVSFDMQGQANILSYGWQGDTTTVYDTSVLNVAPPDVAGAASQLAQDGYILTAFGGDPVNGYVLIGTKVHGDTLPRPLAMGALPGSQPAGYAPVAIVSYPGPDGSVMIYEK